MLHGPEGLAEGEAGLLSGREAAVGPARAEPRADTRPEARPETRPEAGLETRPGPGAITVFCSHGVGSWDLELARIALERAEATGAGHRLGLDMGQWRNGQ